VPIQDDTISSFKPLFKGKKMTYLFFYLINKIDKKVSKGKRISNTKEMTSRRWEGAESQMKSPENLSLW
jgi:hypothetical protein